MVVKLVKKKNSEYFLAVSDPGVFVFRTRVGGVCLDVAGRDLRVRFRVSKQITKFTLNYQ